MMKTKDTLTIYEELKAAGVEETQAKIQAHQLGTFNDFASEILSLVSKIEKDLLWMRAIGAGMIIACFAMMFK